ncbi:kinase-like domain-containing protein [Xylaria arbuscula]|nr:kinase-like domain-containing protein [Xylaria arbuscula]
MTTYNTPLELPYFAPAPAPLPTYHEIIAHASLNKTSATKQRRRARDVIQIGEHFIVKYGKHIDFLEGENMLIVRHHTSIPVPTLYAMYQHEPSGDKVIVMEYVPGTLLSSCYSAMSSAQKASIAGQLRRYLAELRNKIPSAGLFGSPGARPYVAHTWTFKRPAGPFASAGEFVDAYFAAHFSDASPAARNGIEELKTGLLALGAGHSASVFTHADLQTQNMILRRDGSICIIDWESASFCPGYFEFFMYGTLDLVTEGGLEGEGETEKRNLLRYAEMVKVCFEAWHIYFEDRDIVGKIKPLE